MWAGQGWVRVGGGLGEGRMRAGLLMFEEIKIGREDRVIAGLGIARDWQGPCVAYSSRLGGVRAG